MNHAGTRLRVGGVLVLALAALAGCHAKAVSSVRLLVAVEEGELQQSPAVIRDAEVDGYLDDLAAQVLEAARELEPAAGRTGAVKSDIDAYDRYDVVLVHSTALNAWVYGDDFTCLTSNLILHSEVPEEVVAVLCHEFGHLREGHLVESKERELGHMAFADIVEVVGGVAEIAAMAYGLPIQVSGLASVAAHDHRMSFEPGRPGDEFEADEYGLELYAAMGLDIHVYDDLFERCVERYGDPATSSHPSLSERVRRMQDLASRLAAAHEPRRLDRERFLEIRERLRALLARKASANRLVAHEAVLCARGRPAMPQATSCGLLAAEPDALRKGFRAALRP